MKKLLIITMLLSIASSCKKQELASTNPMIGKWKVTTLTVEKKCQQVPASTTFIVGKPFKKAEMEIFPSGEITVKFDGEVQKLKIIKINESPSIAKFQMLPDAVKKYDCKVKDWKGQVYNFHFYFNESTNQMIGTYWTPNHPYHTREFPNSTIVTCSWGAMEYQGYEDEFFAVYQKI